jgi:Tol biopolymer transport system component
LALALTLAACTVELAGPEPTVFVPVITTATRAAGPGRATQPAQWSALGLTGRLLYSDPRQGVLELSLATGATQTLWDLSERGWLSAVAASPARASLALAYSPPPAEGQPQLGYTNIFLLPLAGCQPGGCPPVAPRPLAELSSRYEAYFQPAWSPDGTVLYVAHVSPTDAEANTSFRYSLARLDPATGQSARLLDDAMWPAISPDGQSLAYVHVNPADVSNELMLANADGSNPRSLLGPSTFEAIDAVLFSPDGRDVLFSAVGPGPGGPAAAEAPSHAGWLRWLLGARVAEAHNVPSDWWAVPAAGGAPRRLTHLQDTGLSGAFSPAGNWLAFASSSGLYLMRPDGSALTQLVPGTFTGTLSWVE